jgi:hypothetical protein
MGLGWSLKQFLAIENMVLYCQNTIWELKGLRYDCCVWEIDPHEQEIKKKKKGREDGREVMKKSIIKLCQLRLIW